MFTKKDLKDRMVVETRDGCRYIVVNDLLLSDDGFLRIDGYDDDLLDTTNMRQFDVVKVFDVTNYLAVLYKDKIIDLKVVFDRSDKKQRNKNKAKCYCEKLARLYNLDEREIYDYFVKTLYNNSDSKVSITEFDIEKCSDADMDEAMRLISVDCATYCIIKHMELE